MPRLSPRLQFICDSLVPGGDVWDVCCDHGYVGEWALRRGIFRMVHFVDRVPPIVDKLRARLADFPAADFRAEDAATLAGPVEGSLVVAGVGGHTVDEILAGLAASGALRARRLILGPQKSEEWLAGRLPGLLRPRGYDAVSSTVFREGRRDLPLLIWDLKG